MSENLVTIRHELKDGRLDAWPEFSEGYDGPDVTIDIDPKFTGRQFDVPAEARDHIYAKVGIQNGVPIVRGSVPVDSNAVFRANCAGPGGG